MIKLVILNYVLRHLSFPMPCTENLGASVLKFWIWFGGEDLKVRCHENQYLNSLCPSRILKVLLMRHLEWDHQLDFSFQGLTREWEWASGVCLGMSLLGCAGGIFCFVLLKFFRSASKITSYFSKCCSLGVLGQYESDGMLDMGI